MQRPIRMQEDPRYEMTNFRGNLSNSQNGSTTTRKTNGTKQTKQNSVPSNKEGEADIEKIVEIRQLDLSYDGGVYEVIANNSHGTPDNRKQRSREYHRDALYDSLSIITQTTRQQMDLYRRMMCLITVLLLIILLTASAGLTLTVMMLVSGNALSLNQPATSPPGKG